MTTETSIVRVDPMPRSDNGRRRFTVVADTPFGRVSPIVTEVAEGQWSSRFPEPDRIPPYQRRAVVRAFVAWLQAR